MRLALSTSREGDPPPQKSALDRGFCPLLVVSPGPESDRGASIVCDPPATLRHRRQSKEDRHATVPFPGLVHE
jgi:hypothetical protein